MHLMQLVGDFIPPRRHLFSSDLFQPYDFFEQRIAFGDPLRAVNAVLGRFPHAPFRIFRIIRRQVALQVLEGCNQFLFGRQQFKERSNISRSDKVGLTAADLAQLQQHLMLLTNQLDEFFR